MNISNIIEDLQGNLPIAALENFNTNIDESKDAAGSIHRFLLATKNCDEILNLLTAEKRTPAELATIFTTLGHVLLNIAGELSEFSKIGLHITQQILHNYDAFVYKLLSPSNTNRNSKAVLRCLTGMVMIGGEAASEVLLTVDWQRINVHLLVNRQSLEDIRDVRAWCIYLFLAFLNASEDPHIIRQFLQKKDLLPAIFPGLMWDPCERVINVLKVLHESVLLNRGISKTMKVNIFTPITTKPLLELYDWMGPMGKLARGKNAQEMDTQIGENIQLERAQIKEVLQKFMLTLYTSSKYGIVFIENVQAGKTNTNNSHIYNTIYLKKRPWESPELCELISCVLGACPDILETYLLSIKDFILPRPTQAYINLVEMLTQIIEQQKPWKKMDTRGWEGMYKLILPRPLNHKLFQSLTESCYKTVRHSGLKLVLAILSKTKETINNVISNESLSYEVKHRSQKKLIEVVFKTLMTMDSIIHCWNIAAGQEPPDIQADEQSSTQVETAAPVPAITELLTIAKVLTLYSELLPNQTFHEVINPVEMLQTVRVLSSEDDNCIRNSNTKLELQVLCLGFLAGSTYSEEIPIGSSLNVDQISQIEKNAIYQLISTYAQTKEEFIDNERRSIMLSVTDKCLKILSSSLVKVGLSSHYDGNIKVWLRHISSTHIVKLSTFLTQIIQKTVSSLSSYTDLLVELGAKRNLNTSIHGQMYSFMRELETMEIADNEDIFSHSISLPFSRLTLAAIDLLKLCPDSEYIQYFCNVINEYLHFLSDPGFLADILLQNENILTSDLQKYLKCLFIESKPQKYLMSLSKESKPQEDENSLSIKSVESVNLSEILKCVFMTRDWSSVDSLLEENTLKDLMTNTDLDLIVSQLLLYLHLDSSLGKNETKLVKRYVCILKHLCTILDENDTEHVIQIVLEHPSILANYRPFALKKSPISELTQEFIALVLEKYFKLAPKTCPYFEKIVKDIQIQATNMNASVDFWKPLEPFISSQHSLVSYEAVEQLLLICLKAPCQTLPSLDTLVLELVRLLLKASSAKRKPTTQSIQLILGKFLEYYKTSKFDVTLETIMKELEKFLINTTSAEVAAQLTSDDIKCLACAQPPCAELCCQLVRLHPPHGTVFIKRLKKHGTLLPAQASLLAMLLEEDDILSTSEAALAKVSDEIKMWALAMDDDEDATSKIFAFALEKSMIDKSCMSEICCQLYEKIVTLKQPPPKKLLSLIPVFYKLSENGPVLPKFDLPEEHLALLHICLSCIQNTYYKEEQNTSLLLSVSKIIVEILPKVDKQSCHSILTTNKQWSSFVRKVLRNGLNDQSLGPDLLHILSLLCEIIYKKDIQRSVNEDENTLPIITLYEMVMAHSQYPTLMFNKAREWGRLKEQVIALQQTLVDCEEKVCREHHVPILLGAYGASMSAVDQRILKLLHAYERKGYMGNYEPVLWGDAAIAHFGVLSSGFNLFKEPSVEQILGLLEIDRIMQTCYKFDTRLPLEPMDIQKEDPSIYDMRFLMPLMLYLAEKNITEIDYAECGAVAIGFIALTSHQRDVWGAGAAVLRCMVEKMEKSSHRRLKLPWLWLVGVVSCAFEGKQRRLPALTTHFLIRASQLLSQPGHPMYKPVLNYLFLKPAFKVYYVPELFQLYSSTHITDNREHRSFLLTTLSTGIRQILDYNICQRTFTSTLVIGMLQAPSVDNELRVQALDVLEAMVRIPRGAVELTVNQNLLTVLPLVVLPVNTAVPKPNASSRAATSVNPLLLAAVVRVLSALWSTLMDSIERKDYITKHIEEDECVTVEIENEAVRKRKMNETDQENVKKFKKDLNNSDPYSPEFNLEIQEANLNSESISKEPFERQRKRLPPLFVHEFINCLTLLAPTVIACASPLGTAKHLELIAKSLQYVGTVVEVSNKTRKLCAVAMAPEIIKQQVYDHISWDLLYDRLRERLSEDDEVRLLGNKVKEMWHKWRSEPLNKHLQKEEKATSADEDREEEHHFLKKSVLTLLSTLGK
nr:nucleolar pre-ribosomal-associated protein 1-like [Procambarus clarkii]